MSPNGIDIAFGAIVLISIFAAFIITSLLTGDEE